LASWRVQLQIDHIANDRAVIVACTKRRGAGPLEKMLGGQLDGTQVRLGHATEMSRSLIGRKDGQDTLVVARVVLGADGLGGEQLAGEAAHHRVGEAGHHSVVKVGSRLVSSAASKVDMNRKKTCRLIHRRGSKKLVG
jgi:hypothetical protein